MTIGNEGKTLVNVVRVDFINEKNNEKHSVVTSDEIDIEPIKSDGKRDILRVKNTIYGINQTEDIVIGYKLKMKDNLFNLKTMALIDGGTVTNNKYEGTEAGKTVDRDLFTVDIYTEEKDYSRTIGYAKFTYKHCSGKPTKYKVKDGAFMVPEYEAESIPFRGEKPVEVTLIDSLPNESSNIPIENIGVEGGTITDSNLEVGVNITNRIVWTFKEAINQDDVTSVNFNIKKKTDNTTVIGNVTIDATKKIVTFIPNTLEVGMIYIAEAKAVNKLDGSGTTTALSTEFKTVRI